MRADIVKVDGSIEHREITEKLTLEEMQEIVGGYIERIVMPIGSHDGIRIMLVDEDGNSKRLEYNAIASFAVGKNIVGTALVLDHDLD